MEFNLEEALIRLEATPAVVRHLLSDMEPHWSHQEESTGGWSPFHILAHLIHGEQTDWVPRTQIILDPDSDHRFTPFDMNAHFENSEGKSLAELLDSFETWRRENIRKMRALHIQPDQLEMEGIHPEFGKVVLKEHLAAWVVHDLGHIAQISRVLAKNYKEEVGPWQQYMAILHDREKPSAI